MRNVRPSRAAVSPPRSANDPRQQLPVAASPSMLAGCGNVIARGKILENFDVGDQPGAGENTFQQVVTENATVGNSAGKSGLEGVHVVDAFAAVRPLLEEVLVNVGNGRCVGVDAGWRSRKTRWINRAIPRGGKRLASPGAGGRRSPRPRGGTRDRAFGRLSGCAIFPIRRFAAPMGSRVSVSRVMT